MDTGAKGGNRMLKDLVKANRSYRGYDESRCVTKEELLEMADCGIQCEPAATAVLPRMGEG